MNDIVNRTDYLPATVTELSKFVLVGREKLNAVRAEIRAIDKVGLAQEVHEQKLREAQDIADAVLDAEVRIGELMARVPKEQGKRTDIKPTDSAVGKYEVIREAGFTPKQVERFQTMAKHPEVVEQVKAEAREEGRIVTRESVLKEIKKPHFTINSHDDEWYTPEQYIETARRVMGSIDLDPASNDFANETVKATAYFDESMNGLEQEWYGNIWLNPPYSSILIQRFADKVAESTFEQAVILVNNATETGWFRKLIEKASAVVFTTGRIKYRKRDGEKGTPLQGQAFIYIGDSPERFLEEFKEYGWGARL